MYVYIIIVITYINDKYRVRKAQLTSRLLWDRYPPNQWMKLNNQCCQMEYMKFLEIWGHNFSRNERKSGDSHFHFGILPVAF